MNEDLIDPELFGNEAGEDEDLEILDSYFLEKRSFRTRFYSDRYPLQFVRSKKGVGKSALLKHALSTRRRERDRDLLIYVKGSDLVALQDVKSDTADESIFGWQQRLCSRINMDIGSSLGLALGDDAATLVESAEIAGFRGRNLISSLVDRLKIKAGGVEIQRNRLDQRNAQALLERFSRAEGVSVWLFIDDIDATFINTPEARLKISTFFSACRNLVNAVSGLKIRASVRTDVWTILKQSDESLDKCEQYMLDLKWDTKETGAILERKVLSYFLRRYPGEARYAALVIGRDRQDILNLVFRRRFMWGKRRLEPYKPVHILSAGRPRWAAQLCKLAGEAAVSHAEDRISIAHIKSNLRGYSASRIADLYREHSHQCPNLQDIIEAFAGGDAQYATPDLLSKIRKEIVEPLQPIQIDGVSRSDSELTVAHFLYRIGFICARDEGAASGLSFVRYEDRPNLLSTRANLDDGLDWEIHPSYRNVLRIQRH